MLLMGIFHIGNVPHQGEKLKGAEDDRLLIFRQVLHEDCQAESFFFSFGLS